MSKEKPKACSKCQTMQATWILYIVFIDKSHISKIKDIKKMFENNEYI